MGDSVERLSSEELARLGEIARLDLTSVEQDEELQRIVQRAGKELDLPIGLVSIVLDGAQHFVARMGLGGWLEEANGTPGEWAFCLNAVETKRQFVVEDAREHPVVKDNPLVHNDGVRCYAGSPLMTASGHALGTLCVLGAEPRQFSEEDLAKLDAMAAEVVAHLESRVAAR